MVTIKAGDKVRATKSCSGAICGEVYEVFSSIGKQLFICEGGINALKKSGEGCSCIPSWELIENNKSSMSKISIMMKKLLNSNVQKQVKVGYINGDLELTDKGTKALLSILYTEKEVELTAMADEELVQEEKLKS